MEGREGARESPNPVREGEGGRERARQSPNPRGFNYWPGGLIYKLMGLSLCRPKQCFENQFGERKKEQRAKVAVLRAVAESLSLVPGNGREGVNNLSLLQKATQRASDHHTLADPQQSLSQIWFSNHFLGPQRWRPMSLRVKPSPAQ